MSPTHDQMEALAALTNVLFDGNPDATANAFGDYANGRTANEVLIAVQIWIDAIAAANDMPRGPGGVFGFDFADKVTDRPVDVNDENVPTYLRTAARLITARLNDDRDQFQALIRAVPDGNELQAVCASVLSLAASAIRPRAIADLREAGFPLPGTEN